MKLATSAASLMVAAGALGCRDSSSPYTDLTSVHWPRMIAISAANIDAIPSPSTKPAAYCGPTSLLVECRVLEDLRTAFPSADGSLIFDGHEGLLAVNDVMKNVRTVGELGGGPGQVRTVGDAWLGANGRLTVWDPTLNRVTSLDSTGSVRSQTWIPPDNRYREVHVSPSTAWELVIDPSANDVRTVPAKFVRIIDGLIEPNPRLVIAHPPAIQAGMRLLPLLLDPTPLWTVDSRGHILLVRDRQFRIEVLDSLAHPLVLISGPSSGRVIEQSDIRRATEIALRGFSPSWQPRMRRYISRDRSPAPGSPVPEVTAIRALPGGSIWVRRFPVGDSVTWIRLDGNYRPDYRLLLRVGDAVVSGSDSSVIIAGVDSGKPVLAQYRLARH